MGYETKFDKDNDTKTLFCLCDCKSEILVIEYDHDIQLADLAVYKYAGFANKLSLFDRFRYVMKIIWSGKPYADQMVLTPKQLKEIKNFCSDILN
jgi:hypothetical protein